MLSVRKVGPSYLGPVKLLSARVSHLPSHAARECTVSKSCLARTLKAAGFVLARVLATAWASVPVLRAASASTQS